MIMVCGDPIEVHQKEKKATTGRIRPKSSHKQSKSQPGFNFKLQSIESKAIGVADTPNGIIDDLFNPFINVTTREKEILKSIIKPDSPQEKVK